MLINLDNQQILEILHLNRRKQSQFLLKVLDISNRAQLTHQSQRR